MFDNIRFNFLYIDIYSFGKNWVYPESTVPYNMLRYIESGSGTFFIDNEEFIVGKSQIVYIPKGSKLSCYTTGNIFSFTSIRFTNSVYFDGGDFLKDYYGIPNVMDGAEEKVFFEKIYHYIKDEDPARMFFVRGYMELLIGSLISKVSRMNPEQAMKIKRSEEYTSENLVSRIKKATTKIDSRIQTVLDYVILHPFEEYTPQILADMADLSKQRFSSLFKEQLGKSPMVYIKDLKLTTAARKLLVSNASINDIAYSTGYKDPNYFIREFKEAFGYTPRQYRLAAKE